MINRHFDDIQKADIDALIENEVRESRTLEYKQEMPGNADEQKKEFLADVSSFANTGGGDILFGISEKRENGKNTGLPDTTAGLPGLNADAEVRRLDDIIRTGIDPRIPRVQMKAIEGFANGSVFLLRVPRSWASPHMVTYKNTSRFYSRTSAGKYQLDVREIRAAFALSENLSERMTRFRSDRIGKIVANEGAVPLAARGKIILHVLPASAFDTASSVDLSSLLNRDINPLLISSKGPFAAHNRWPRFNSEGFIMRELMGTTPPNSEVNHAYVQIFRSGIHESVEVVDASIENYIPASFPQRIVSAVRQALKIDRDLGVEPPFVVAVSMVDIKGYELIVPGNTSPAGYGQPIDNEVLLLPDILIESYDVGIRELLRPTFDALWQASGYAGVGDDAIPE